MSQVRGGKASAISSMDDGGGIMHFPKWFEFWNRDWGFGRLARRVERLHYAVSCIMYHVPGIMLLWAEARRFQEYANN